MGDLLRNLAYFPKLVAYDYLAILFLLSKIDPLEKFLLSFSGKNRGGVSLPNKFANLN